MTYHAIINSPIGKLGIKHTNSLLTHVEYVAKNLKITGNDRMIKEIEYQLNSYFVNPNHNFNFSLDALGTPFQQRVWRTLLTIPCGETRTYQDLAILLNTSPRAIGNACRKNPIAIIIPCHRVVAKNSLGGYSGETSGATLDKKIWLLEHEKAVRGGLKSIN